MLSRGRTEPRAAASPIYAKECFVLTDTQYYDTAVLRVLCLLCCPPLRSLIPLKPVSPTPKYSRASTMRCCRCVPACLRMMRTKYVRIFISLADVGSCFFCAVRCVFGFSLFSCLFVFADVVSEVRRSPLGGAQEAHPRGYAPDGSAVWGRVSEPRVSRSGGQGAAVTLSFTSALPYLLLFVRMQVKGVRFDSRFSPEL